MAARPSQPARIPLSQAQALALRHIGRLAEAHEARHVADLARILRDAGVTAGAAARAAASMDARARIALHFHPDRISQGLSVAEHLLVDGIYRNQFETGISNGSLSAVSGGKRDRWEIDLFGDTYGCLLNLPRERPIYAALDLMRHGDGPAPRFGACYLILKPAVMERCTFTLGDSSDPPDYVGVSGAMGGIMRGLVEAVASGAWDLGVPGLTISGLIARLSRDEASPDAFEGAPGRILDQYVEAQIHGPVQLDADAEMLVVDPSFRGTATGRVLEEVCSRHGLVLRWHMGFVLPVADVSDAFRGPAMPHLARRVAPQGTLDAAAIGRAAASLARDPAAWADWGPPTDTQVQLKELWHVVVHQGRPAAMSADWARDGWKPSPEHRGCGASQGPDIG